MCKKIWLLLSLSVMIAGMTVAGGPFYVNSARSDDTGSGLSWATAKKTVTAAFALVDTIDPADVVYIAGGTYRTTSAAFTPAGNASIYGGYNPSSPYNRNIDLYETILSGDVNGNDTDIDLVTDPCGMYREAISVTGSRYDNKQVLSLTSKTCTVDGLTIRNGMAGNGAGADCNGGTVTFNNCLFTQNFATGNGGCVYASTSGTPSVTMTNCQCIQNGSYGTASVVYMRSTTGSLTTQNCLFSVHIALNDAGAFYLRNSPTVTITDCIFDRCKMGENVGGGSNIMTRYSVDGSSPTLNITNTLFKEGYSVHHGAAVYIQMRTGGGGTVNPTTNVTNCLMIGCTNQWADGTNVAAHIERSDCYGTGILNLTNCTITNNHPNAQGAVGAFCGVNDPLITIAVNLKNSIVWGNAGGTPANNLAQLLIDSTALGAARCSITANYCCLNTTDPNDYGYNRSLGSNNVFTDPSLNSVYFLNSGSNCTNAGDNTANSTTTDLAGKPRKNGTIDIGAYEYYQTGDVNGSGKVNLVDFEAMASNWLDTGCSMNNRWCNNTDLNYSGTVDMADYSILATNWLLP